MTTAFIKKIFQHGGFDLKSFDKAQFEYSRLYGKYRDYTMIPKNLFILNLDLCHAFGRTEGAYVECGVWRGGMSAAVAEVLGGKKQIHLFDSFEGLPPAKEIDGIEALSWQKDTTSPNYFDNCAAGEQFAIEAMKLASHDKYQIHKGWFEKTVPGSVDGPIGILRLDGDWYDSIMVCLEELFPRVVEGGIVILDDYYCWEGCAKAVHDYLSRMKAPSRVFQWHDGLGYIVKKN
jgi:O-methyltransferase